MITDYMEDLTYDSHNFGRTPYNKYIYKNSGSHYIIRKMINGKQYNYGTYSSWEEAREVRDLLIANNWDKSVIQEELDQQAMVKKYYKHIQRNGRYYAIYNFQNQYCGQVKTIEEALYYRDLVHDLPLNEVKSPKSFDLITDNPYIDNIEVELPERLIRNVPSTTYGTGYIQVKGPQSYHIHYGSKSKGNNSYVCACRTYEQAYYVKQELNKVGWDLSKLDEILENYPVWYTWLNNLYKFVTPNHNGGKGWTVNVTPNHSSSGKLEHIYCRKLEDALWERDLLLKYDFDEELLVECADDTMNPYYNMELPPYPQRKIRRIKEREPRTGLFDDLCNIIQEEPNLSQEEYCEIAGTTSINLRNILKREFNSNWAEFKRICESGENPNDVLEQEPLIYNPDLSLHTGGEYIARYDRLASKYVVSKWVGDRNHYFGAYPTRELAEKIVKDLQACNWDKSQLKSIQAKHNHVSMVNSKRWVYENKYKGKKGVKVSGYSVRHKNKDKKMVNYGSYKDKRVAELVRDLLVDCDWDKSQLESIQDYSYYCISEVDKYEGYKGY